MPPRPALALAKPVARLFTCYLKGTSAERRMQPIELHESRQAAMIKRLVRLEKG